MNLSMEYISDKYNIYKLSKKEFISIKLFWGYLFVIGKWWKLKVLKNDRLRFCACHLKLFETNHVFTVTSLVDICQKQIS